MANSKDGALLRQLDTLFNMGVIRELTDGQLLERFATGAGEAAELAFAALVERHGPMVMRVCRAQLVDDHDAQDAFQATFLILVRKARGLWVRDSLGPWLHQVAFRTATCARSAAARRRRHERRAAEASAGLGRREGRTDADLEQMIHSEIDRLPERYRVPIVLCDLQGHTCEEAAWRMGRPVGTVKCWRSRGRERLRDRLIRLGLAPSAGLAAALATDVAGAAVPTLKAEETVRLAARVLSQRVTAGEVPASVRTLVSGVLTTMLIGKLRMTAAAIVALAGLAAGLGTVARVGADDVRDPGDEVRGQVPLTRLSPRPWPDPAPSGESREIWPLSLREAIRIGLGKSEWVQKVGSPAGGTRDSVHVIARPDTDLGTQELRAKVMADLRAIEQQYWSLAQQHAQLWSSEKAVELAEEIKKREESALHAGRGTVADVAEASQRLEQFRLDLVTKTSDVITTERQLRFLLGLPRGGRRIVPVTPPTESLLEPDWEKCRLVMLEHQPDVLRAKEAAARAAHSPDGPDQAVRQKARLVEVVDQATHALDRFFRDLDANYKQFQTASRIRAGAAQRLEAQRAFYEEGRMTIDRYLDAVSQYASAVAQEAQFKASYNVSIVALEEAKGTLIEYDGITMVGTPTTTGAIARREGPAKPRSPEPMTPAAIAPPPLHPTTAPGAKVEDPTTDPAGKTFSFQFTVGRGPRPVEVRGSFTITPARSTDGPKLP